MVCLTAGSIYHKLYQTWSLGKGPSRSSCDSSYKINSNSTQFYIYDTLTCSLCSHWCVTCLAFMENKGRSGPVTLICSLLRFQFRRCYKLLWGQSGIFCPNFNRPCWWIVEWYIGMYHINAQIQTKAIV